MKDLYLVTWTIKLKARVPANSEEEAMEVFNSMDLVHEGEYIEGSCVVSGVEKLPF